MLENHQSLEIRMIQPEEDYPTWFAILQSSKDQIEDFCKFIPSIDKLANCIIETDEFPEPIKDFKNDFLQQIYNYIICPIFKFSTLSESQIQNLYQFFKILVNLSCYGIKVRDIRCTSLFASLFNHKDAPLVKNNKQFDFFKQICNYAYECGFLDISYEALLESSNSMDSVYYIFFGCINIINYIQPDKLWKFISLTQKAILNICGESLRNVNTSLVSSLVNESLNTASRFNEIDNNFVLQWLAIFSSFINSDIFEKQLFGLKAISLLLSKVETKNVVIDWFRSPENLDIISGKDMHSEFIALYNVILPELAEADILTSIFLTNLWDYHQVQHSSQLYHFFMIFNSIAAKLNIELMMDYVNMCLHPNNQNEIWVRFIHQLGLTLGKRGDSEEAFLLIRNTLLSFLLDNKPFVLDLVSELLPYYTNSENIVNLIHDFQGKFDHSLSFYRLMQQASSIPFKDQDLAYDLLENAIVCVKYNNDSSPLIFGFISNICTANRIGIPKDQLEALFELSQIPNFYPFLISLIQSGFVSFDYVEQFIINKDPNTVTKNFFDLVKAFILDVNNCEKISGIKKLPFEKEDLLWLWSTTESSCVDLFIELLCTFYYSNDGVELTDLVMIQTFLHKWFEVSKTRNLDLLLRLMKSFLILIEQPLDVSLYHLQRHNSSFDQNTVSVNVTGIQLPAHQTHTVPENMLVAALKHRIAREAMIPTYKLRLVMNQRYVKEDQIVKCISTEDGKVHVSIKVIDTEPSPHYHERTCIPSQVISQSSFIVDNLINCLKNNREEAKQILDLLPTDISTLIKIEEISKREHFDYSELLPIEYPLLFRYNLESIKIKLSEDKSGSILMDSFDKTGGFVYLADHINSPDLVSSIVPFLKEELSNDLTIQLGQKLFDSLFPSLVESNPDQIIYQNNCLFLVNVALVCPIVLNEAFYSDISTILFSEHRYVVQYGKQLLASISIPLHVFLDQLTEENQDVIFDVCVPHVDVYLPVFYEKFIENPQNYSLLLIIEKLLQLNLIESNEIKMSIQTVLIQNYLTIDSRPKNSQCFRIALRCLTFLQTQELYEHLKNLHDTKSVYKNWAIDGDSATISSTEFSGLTNLGTTCFLNATLQQFFGIPPLRKSIIEYQGTDVFMIQLRNLFAKMLLSKGHTLSPDALVSVWTGWDNEKMDPRLQQDACEFSQILIDKLEKGLGGRFIRALFAGTTVDNIEGISDTYHVLRSQTVYTFTLSIKDLNSINDALFELQAPDFFTGTNQYYAEKLDRKIDAKKYQTIGTLPPYLIIQLSRFSYNYDTWERIKIDTPFEFPIDLDLSDYVSDKNQITQFKLRGVILHSGTAKYGHYVSYVADRATGKWRCCNDNQVAEISEKEVLTSSFGHISNKNAYLLFYDRIDTLENLRPPSIHCVPRQINEVEENNEQKTEIENNDAEITNEPGETNKTDQNESVEKVETNNNDGNESQNPCIEINFEESNDIYITEDLYEESQNEKRLNDEYSLFCSSPYYNFCLNLSKSPILDFVFISLRYYFDTLPYTKQADQSGQIGENIIHQLESHPELTQMFSQFLVGQFAIPLIYSPLPAMRQCTLEMIDSLEADQYTEEFLNSLISVLDTVLPYYFNLGDYFELFHRIITKSEQVTLYAINNQWIDRFSRYIIEDIPTYLQINQLLKPTYFYSVIELSGLFKTMSNLNPPEELIKYILNYENFKLFLYDPCRPCDAFSLVELLMNFDDQQAVRDFIAGFAAHYGIYVDSFKLLHIIYQIFQMNAFDVISSSILRIKEDFDFASSLAAEAMYDSTDSNCAFRTVLLENLDQWLIKYLINDNMHCQLATVYIIVFILPVTLFQDIQVIQLSNVFDVYGDVRLNLSIDLNTDNPNKDRIINDTEKIQTFFLSNQRVIANRINESASSKAGIDFIYCLDKLSCITQTNMNQFWINFATKLLTPKQIFDPHLKFILSILVRKIPEQLSFDLILSFTNYAVFNDPVLQENHEHLVQDKSGYNRALQFFLCIESLADQLTPPIDFVQVFISEICYTSFSVSRQIYKALSTFIKRFAAIYPNVFVSYLHQNLDFIASYCYSLMIVTLEATNTKMPILKYLAKAATKKQFFTLDELIIKSFEFNPDIDGISNEEVNGPEYEYEYNNHYEEEEEEEEEYEHSEHDRKRTKIKKSTDNGISSIVSLLNSPLIGHEARSLIWNLVYKEKPSYQLFKTNYSWRGDFIEYVQYLLLIAPILSQSDDHSLYKECSEDIIECSKKSSDCFALSADYLIENDLTEILQRGFCDCILKLEIGANVAVYEKYLNILSENIAKCYEDRELALKEFRELLMPLIACVERRVNFLVDVFGDLKFNSIDSSDLKPLFAPLKLLTIYKDIISDCSLMNDLRQLSQSCGNQEVIDKVKYKEDLFTLHHLVSSIL